MTVNKLLHLTAASLRYTLRCSGREDGVVSLSGALTAADSKRVALSVIMNGLSVFSAFTGLGASAET